MKDTIIIDGKEYVAKEFYDKRIGEAVDRFLSDVTDVLADRKRTVKPHIQPKAKARKKPARKHKHSQSHYSPRLSEDQLANALTGRFGARPFTPADASKALGRNRPALLVRLKRLQDNGMANCIAEGAGRQHSVWQMTAELTQGSGRYPVTPLLPKICSTIRKDMQDRGIHKASVTEPVEEALTLAGYPTNRTKGIAIRQLLKKPDIASRYGLTFTKDKKEGVVAVLGLPSNADLSPSIPRAKKV
jgi:hypothetical protein